MLTSSQPQTREIGFSIQLSKALPQAKLSSSLD